MRRETPDRPSYEPPELQVLGTLHELTLGDFCLFNKTFGSPDFIRVPLPAASTTTWRSAMRATSVLG